MATLVSPSLLSADFNHLEEEIKRAVEAGADYIHYDVMDGQFVNNISFGLPILKASHDKHPLVNDVHLMIKDPYHYVRAFAKTGANIITFHYETCKKDIEVFDLLDYIHFFKCKAGISIKPNTPVKKILPFLGSVDMILIMSVEPGFGGQAFDPRALTKIKELKEYLVANEYKNVLIEVDGGVNDVTGRQCVDAGADILVAGSYLFGHDDMKKRIDLLKDSYIVEPICEEIVDPVVEYNPNFRFQEGEVEKLEEAVEANEHVSEVAAPRDPCYIPEVEKEEAREEENAPETPIEEDIHEAKVDIPGVSEEVVEVKEETSANPEEVKVEGPDFEEVIIEKPEQPKQKESIEE